MCNRPEATDNYLRNGTCLIGIERVDYDVFLIPEQNRKAKRGTSVRGLVAFPSAFFFESIVILHLPSVFIHI